MHLFTTPCCHLGDVSQSIQILQVWQCHQRNTSQSDMHQVVVGVVGLQLGMGVGAEVVVGVVVQVGVAVAVSIVVVDGSDRHS